MQFALMDGGRFVVMQELDRIFNGNDVIIFLAINAVEQDSEGGRLSRTGGPGDKHDSIAQLGPIGEEGGGGQRTGGRNYGGNHAHHHRPTAPLASYVVLKPGYGRHNV